MHGGMRSFSLFSSDVGIHMVGSVVSRQRQIGAIVDFSKVKENTG